MPHDFNSECRSNFDDLLKWPCFHLNYTIIIIQIHSCAEDSNCKSSEWQATQANTKRPEYKPGRREVDVLAMVVATWETGQMSPASTQTRRQKLILPVILGIDTQHKLIQVADFAQLCEMHVVVPTCHTISASEFLYSFCHTKKHHKKCLLSLDIQWTPS